MNKKRSMQKSRGRAGGKRKPTMKRKRAGGQSEAAGIEIVRLEQIEEARGLGLEAGGQSGDIYGLSREPLAGSESVEELVEEGQDLEAELIGGVEEVPDADEGPIKIKERRRAKGASGWG